MALAYMLKSVITVTSVEKYYDLTARTYRYSYTFTRTTTWSNGTQTITSAVDTPPAPHTPPEEAVMLAPGDVSGSGAWYASRSSRCSSSTCQICIAHDKAIYTEANAKEWVANGRSHANCQCTVTYFPESSLQEYMNRVVMERW